VGRLATEGNSHVGSISLGRIEILIRYLAGNSFAEWSRKTVAFSDNLSKAQSW